MEISPLNHFSLHFGINTPSYTHTIFISPFSWQIGFWQLQEGTMLQLGAIKLLSSPAPPCAVCARMRAYAK